ncbi:plasmid partitioning protein RepB [Paenirhodobacter populi]|uniref:Plasmid partitioning protein RepB n=1 Tax=Paenirhodobacter populi TaxID=2306993 RepID=A0A443K7N6_9RHOB|nr:plasmid partitioning protein RepB [Sinirhodobacter populi]RWR04100.1 plasmid partitioning protein RepB [Sinirhodobacter populi]RWR17315.1 plasmid partitioning protein RepB [Sinirhodobacter populi]RWR28760.1 plasmid partitioning protein RepB [Sinirhodobacter populi]
MRKNLLASSLKAVRDGKAATTEEEQKPRKLSGVLDVQRGLDQLSAGAARQIDPAQISESAVKDRFDVQDGLEDLVSSIRTSGQKLPVLLRRTHQGPLPYEVVYGRRRIEACRLLGIQVLAHIAELSDREALISQGLENAARLQRSFIEQSVYAEQLLRHEFSREDIMEVLAVDKTTISRMLGVVTDVPRAVIDRIGPAHDSGRRPWQQLRDLLKERTDLDQPALVALIPTDAASSNERLHGLIRALTQKSGPTPPVSVKRVLAEGRVKVESAPGKIVIRSSGEEMRAFSTFLDERLEQLLADFRGDGDD